MSKGNIIIAAVVFLFVLLGFYACNVNNNFAKLETEVEEKWGNVQADYQRRFDLIENLEQIAENYAGFEKATLTEVTQARQYASDIVIKADNISEAELQKINEAQQTLSGALGRFLSVAEKYPDLKANENFKAVMVSLEGTENRINTSRKYYNESVKEYNYQLKRFPAGMLGRMFGYESRRMFEAQAGAEKGAKIKKFTP